MYEYKAKVTDVLDGDTFKCEVDLGFRTYTKIRVRLKDVDTPELRGVGDKEKEAALEAKEFTKGMLGQECFITSHYEDIYARWVCDVYVKTKTGKKVLLQDLLRKNKMTKEDLK